MTAHFENDRKVLVAVTQADLDAMDAAAKRDLFRQHGIGLLVLDGVPLIEPALNARMLDQFALQPGTRLVQNPYMHDRYFLYDEAPQEIAVAKTLCVAEVCHMLGAISFKVTQISEGSSERGWQADGAGPVKGTLTKLGVGRSAETQLARRIALEDTSTGGEPDVSAARRYLAETHLSGDSVLSALVDTVGFAGNKLVSRTLTIDASREGRSALELAASLNVKKVGKFGASGGPTNKQVEQLNITYAINF